MKSQKKLQPRLWLRWVFVLSLIGLLAAGTAAVLAFSKKSADKKALQALSLANEFSMAGKTADAVRQIEVYLSRFPENTAVLKQYAERIMSVPEPNNGHIRKAMNAHQRIVALDPDNQDSVEALLGIYDQAGMSTEAIKQADLVLSEHPEHQEAILVKARQLTVLGEFDDAYSTLDRLHEIDPLDLKSNRLRLLIMNEQGLRNSQLEAWADFVAADAIQDPRGTLIKAFALTLGTLEDRKRAAPLMLELELGDAADESLYELALQIHDVLAQYDEAIELCRRAAIERGFESMRSSLIKRLWDAQRPSAVVALFEDNEEIWSYEKLDRVMHLVAWSYIASENLDGYQVLVAKRREQTRSRYELLWYDLLDQLSTDLPQGNTGKGEKDALGALETARLQSVELLIEEGLELFSWDPYLHYWAGRLDASERRLRAAIGHWERSISGASAWLPPYYLLIEARLQAQQSAEGYQLAIRLLQRDQSLPTVLAYLSAAQVNLDDLPKEHFLQVASIIESLQSQLPMASVAALEVEVLARQGNFKDAKAVLGHWLNNSDVELSQGTLIAMARVNQKHQLEYEEKIFDIFESLFGKSPSMSAIRAVSIAAEQGVEAGLAAYDFQQPEVLTSEGAVDWGLARAKLIERLNPNKATEYWQELVTRHPNNAKLLTAAAEADSVWTDLDDAEMIVKKLQVAVGTDAYESRVASVGLNLARSLSMAKTQQDRVLAESVRDLASITRDYPHLLSPQLLMAQAQERLGKAAIAAQYYGQAFAVAPNRAGILLAQASALVRAGQLTVAKSLVQEHEYRFSDKPADLLAFAAWWRQQDEQANVSRLLSRASNLMPENRALRLEQARLQLDQGDTQEVSTWVMNALGSPDVPTILFAARLYGELSQFDGLNVALSAIDQLPETVSSAEKAWLNAECVWRLGDHDKAELLFEEATSDPETISAAAEGWLLLSLGQPDAQRMANALNILNQATGLESPLSEFVLEKEKFIAGYGPETRSVLLDGVRGRLSVAVCSEVVREIMHVREKRASWRDILPTLTRAADLHPQSPSLAGLEIVGLLQSAQSSEAVVKATAAHEAFPNDIPIRMLHLTARNSAQHWQEVIKIGEELANQGGSAGRVGAVAAARAALKLGDGDIARQMLVKIKTQNQILSSEHPDLKILWLASAFANAEPVRGHEKLLVSIISEPDTRSAVLSLLIETRMRKTGASPSIALGWIDRLSKVVPSDDPNNRQRLGVLARVCWDQWQTVALSNQVVGLLESLFKYPDKEAAAALILGQMKEVQGELGPAGEYYQRVLKRQPDNLVALNNYAMVSSELGNHDRAMTLAIQAKGVAPQAAFVLDTVALVSLAAQKIAEATEAIEAAMTLAPDVAEWRITACKVYLAAGQMDSAIAQIAVLKTLNTQGRLTAADRAQMRDLESQIESNVSALR